MIKDVFISPQGRWTPISVNPKKLYKSRRLFPAYRSNIVQNNSILSIHTSIDVRHVTSSVLAVNHDIDFIITDKTKILGYIIKSYFINCEKVY